MTASIRVLLVDDHTLVRKGFRSLIEEEAGMEVVGEAETGAAAIEMARDLNPDVVVMDVGLPDMSGIEAARLLLASVKGVRIMALSMHNEYSFIRNMVESGSSGYLLKDCSPDEFTDAIRTIVEGHTCFSREVAAILDREHSRKASRKKGEKLGSLTEREREVLILLARGFTVRQIAEKQGRSIHTVHSHRKGILKKLGLGSNVEISRYAAREGLVKL